jgi:hypothetical protein
MSTNFARAPEKCPSPTAAQAGEPARPANALTLHPDLPPGLASRPRVLLLIDTDAVSWGVAGSTASGRASDLQVRRYLDVVQATARALDPQARARHAASSKTAAHHLDVLTSSGNGTWSIRRGRDGADQVLLEELNDLIEARILATRPRRPRSARLADLVILVAADHIYAPAVRQLRFLKVPTWLIVPGQFVAASLYSCSCAVSFLGPERPDSHIQRRPAEPPAPGPLFSGSGSAARLLQTTPPPGGWHDARRRGVPEEAAEQVPA